MFVGLDDFSWGSVVSGAPGTGHLTRVCYVLTSLFSQFPHFSEGPGTGHPGGDFARATSEPPHYRSLNLPIIAP